MQRRLSKSRFIAGWQCPLRLWLQVHHPELAPPPDEQQQAVFDTGNRVGELARERYPGGQLIEADHRQIEAAREQTRWIMGQAGTGALYEPAFQHRDVLTRVDVLAPAEEGWDLIEVKSSTRAKEVFQVDVAVQYWILVGAGIPVERAGLLVLNRDYVYPGGPLDLGQLFRFEDLTEDSEARFDWVTEQVEFLHRVAADDQAPDIEMGPQCESPYPCPFLDYCGRGREFPEHPVTILPGLQGNRLAGLKERGVESVEAIPDDYPLTGLQERVRQATLRGQPWESGSLRAELERVQWPLFYLDFEAAMMAVPMYPGMRPYDPLPFQFSCHVQRSPGAGLEHKEFLATDPNTDPREPLALALLEVLGEQGSIIVYSGYEWRTIQNLAQAVPTLSSRLIPLGWRLVDLLAILRNHYYHPAFRGSYSIKQVLPVLAPDMGYDGLEVADGQAAGRAWQEMLASEDPMEQKRLEEALRIYCRQDSLAMYRLREALLVDAS